MRALLVAAAVAALGRPASACECEQYETDAEADAAALVSSDVAFDGWVVDDGRTFECPAPSAPPAKKGCLAIRLLTADCSPDILGPLLTDSGGDKMLPEGYVADKQGVARYCHLKKGRYTLYAGGGWVGDPDGTTAYGISIDFDGSAQGYAFVEPTPTSQWTIGTVAALKGDVRGVETVVSGSDCGDMHLQVGEAMRLFGTRKPDGTVRLHGCTGRRLTDEEARAPRPVPPEAVPPPTADAGAAPARAAPRTGCGCSAGGAPDLAAFSLLLLLLLRRLDRR